MFQQHQPPKTRDCAARHERGWKPWKRCEWRRAARRTIWGVARRALMLDAESIERRPHFHQTAFGEPSHGHLRAATCADVVPAVGSANGILEGCAHVLTESYFCAGGAEGGHRTVVGSKWAKTRQITDGAGLEAATPEGANPRLRSTCRRSRNVFLRWMWKSSYILTSRGCTRLRNI
jgi:hypothetical protein